MDATGFALVGAFLLAVAALGIILDRRRLEKDRKDLRLERLLMPYRGTTLTARSNVKVIDLSQRKADEDARNAVR